MSMLLTIASGSCVGFWAAKRLAKAGWGPANDGAAVVGMPASSDMVVGKPAGAPGWPASRPGGKPAGPPGANWPAWACAWICIKRAKSGLCCCWKRSEYKSLLNE